MSSQHHAGETSTSAGRPGLDSARVTAVVVAHNGTRWLPHLFSALEASSRFPDHLVAVDTGSTDDTESMLVDVLGRNAVLSTDAGTGFGGAVQQALDHSWSSADQIDHDGWVWLLHDDCAPAPDALERLLEVGESDAAISVVGGRVRAWPRARRLLEVGVTMTGTGHRDTGVEVGEYDQGQHDLQHDVLAVSSAGMLVRRDTWDRLGGFDPRLPLFADDVDFGWRVAKAGGRVVVAPAAVMFHAEAASRGVRQLGDLPHVPRSPHRAARQAALYTLLANCRAAALPFQYVRLALGSVLRALAYLAGKLPSAARDELLAMVSVLGRPHRILGARHRRRRTTTAPHRAVRALLPAWWTPYANALDSLLSRFAGTLRDTATQVAAVARRRRSADADVAAVESGPVPDEAVNLPTGPGPVAWMAGHPRMTLTTVLTAAALVATRDLWGGGWLQGGGLLPAPLGASGWWQTYAEPWHHVGMGSRETPSPYVAIMAMLSTLLLGKSWLAVQLVLVLAVPLAAVGAYAAARHLVDSGAVRIWMALSYALLPVLAGVTSSGRLGTTVAVIVLPWLVPVVVRLRGPERSRAWRAVFAGGLVLSTAVAFAPIVWPMAAVAAIGGGIARLIARLAARQRPDLGTLVRFVVAVTLPLVLLLPWSGRLLSSPSLFLTEAGQVDPDTPSVADHAGLLPWGRIDAAGDAPWWFAVGLVLAAAVALLRRDRRTAVVGAWGFVVLGLVTTAVLGGQLVTVPGTEDQAYVWTGLPVVVAQAGAVVAAGVAADGVSRVIESGSFGWRQPLAAFTAILAVLGPVVGLIWWVGTAPQGDLRRAPAVPLPAYMVSQMQESSQQRVLVIDATPHTDAETGEVSWSDTYTVYAGDGYRLGDDSVVAEPSASLTALVSELVTEATPDDAAGLANRGIAFVAMPTPTDTDQVAQLDGLPGLSGASTTRSRLVAWQVDGDVGLVRIEPAGPTRDGGTADAHVLPSEDGHVDEKVADEVGTAGTAGTDGSADTDRVVRVATSAPDGFEASIDGRALGRIDDESDGSDSIAFTLPAGSAGDLTVDPGGHRSWWLAGQATAVLLALVLAAPTVQRPVTTAQEEEEDS